MLILKVFGIIFASYVLGKTTGHLIKHLSVFSRVFKVGQFEATAIIVAIATSLPEILVSVSASLSKVSSLALGNAIGSNVVNLSLVIGITAMAGRSLHFKGDIAIKNKFLPIAYTLIPFLMLWDGKLSRLDGVILIFIYLIYAFGLLKRPKEEVVVAKKSVNAGKVSMLVLKLGFWMGMMLLASQAIVYLARQVAMDFNLPILFIGLFVVAVGTSLPELIFNIKAARERMISMSMGNVVGSCVANSTLVVGLSALINPIVINNYYQVALPGMEYVFIVILLLFFVWSKHRLDWWEGLILTILFVYYTILGMVAF
jgi:cation:H+ antiporter